MTSTLRTRSLHWLLWQVIALACLPILLLTFLDYREQRQEALRALDTEVGSVLLAARLGQEASLRSLQQTFEIMARADNLRRLDPQDCAGLAQRLLRSMVDFSDLGAARPNGRLWCSAQEPGPDADGPPTVNAQGWFRDALSGSGMTAGEVITDSVRGPQLVFGYPVRSRTGQLQAVLYAAMAPSRFAQLMVRLELPAGWNAFLLGADAKMLSYWPEGSAPAQPDAATVAAFQAALAQGRSTVELRGFDGHLRMYGVSRPGSSKTPLLVAVGAPLTRTIERIEQAFVLRVAVLLALALLSMLAARYWVYGLVDAWARRATQTLQALAAGELAARMSAASPVRELAMVEEGINTMAAQLQQRRRELLRLSSAVQQSPVAMLITDAQERIEYVNPAFERLTGYTHAEVLGRHPDLLNAGTTAPEVYVQMQAQLRNGQPWSGEFQSRRKDGQLYQDKVTIAPLRAEGAVVTHYAAVIEDVTAQRQVEAQIERLAYYDALTGLHNRAWMHQHMGQLLQPPPVQCTAALLLFDVDRFKQVNDTWGHAAGDALLRCLAQRLQGLASAQASLARMGSNTFALLEPQLGTDPASTAEAAQRLASQVVQELALPVTLDEEQQLYVSVSGGATLLCGTARTAAQLLKQAEVALYRAEAAGGGAALLFDAAMQAQVDGRATLEMGLRQALDQQSLVLHYQAQVDAEGRIKGAEVLLRWPQGPQGQPVSPAQFIPLAEDTGLIVPLGLWVLDGACAQLARWQAQPQTAQLTLSVNVSARQFHQSDFAAQVAAALARHQVQPRGLVLELTESAILGGLEATAARMHALRALGLRFALDDFGTGYSSLSYLQQLPFDELKIDQSFTRAMLQDPASSAIVRAILMMCRALGLTVVAEGVETAAHHDFLRRHDCQGCQGYWFGRPMAIADWERQHLAASQAVGVQS